MLLLVSSSCLNDFSYGCRRSCRRRACSIGRQEELEICGGDGQGQLLPALSRRRRGREQQPFNLTVRANRKREREGEICRNNGNGEKEKLQQSDQTMHAYPKLSQSHGTSLYSMVYLGEPSFFLPQWSVRISGRNCSLFSRGGQTSVAGWVTVGGGRLWGMGRRRGSWCQP